MGKNPKTKEGASKKKALPQNICKTCFDKTGKKIVMSETDPGTETTPGTLSCPECNEWKKKENETKTEKIARKKKELAELEKED